MQWLHEQPMNHISLKNRNRPWCYVKLPTVQDAFRPIPGLISCAGVTGRWGLLSHAQKCNQMAGLIKSLVETPWKHHLFMQLFIVQLSFVWRSCIAVAIVNHHMCKHASISALLSILLTFILYVHCVLFRFPFFMQLCLQPLSFLGCHWSTFPSLPVWILPFHSWDTLLASYTHAFCELMGYS